MANLIGQQRGNFKLTRLLGQGGFAEVYLGENIHVPSNKVAIKILYAHLDDKGKQQFKDEANTLTSLKHPHIIQVTDFGFDNNDIPYLIMEYAPNSSLANLHPIGKPLPIATVVDYIKQVASALQHAHTNKIIHRDVKPANMLIGANNSILLSDFGIARVVQTYSVGTVHIVGSIQYMSPEQWDKKAVFASDQYSLGVVAYQWLCGNLPFQGEMQQLWYQHRTETLPPFPPQLHIPSPIENVVIKALAKKPEQRFANVQEFASTLEQASKGMVFPVQTSSPNKVAEREKLPTQAQSMQLLQPSTNMDIGSLYRQGVEAYAKGEEASRYSYQRKEAKDSLETAEELWQQVLATDPNYMNGTLKTRFTKLQEQLHPIRVRALNEQMQNYRRSGKWQEAIQTGEVLLKLEPEDAEAQKNISTARHNMQYAPMYATAQQFVQEGKLAAAKAELAELKIYAPEYGDPAGLAAQLDPPAAAIQPSVHVQKNKRQDRINFVRRLVTTNVEIWLNIFLFLSGTGVVSGLVAGNWISQSWIVAIGIIAILALVVYWLGYRKATGPFPMTAVTLLSIAVVFAVTWYTSKLNYNYTEASSFWFAHRHLWIGRQVNLGLIIGIVPGIVLFCLITMNDFTRKFIPMIYDWIMSNEFFSFKGPLFFLAIGIGFVAILYIIFGGLELFLGWSLGGWGEGFGFGWYFTWLPILPTLLAGFGILQFLEVVFS